jgi:acylphosphatase
VVAEGEKGALEQLITFCRKGPPGAKVLDVDVEWQEYQGVFDDFEVRY